MGVLRTLWEAQGPPWLHTCRLPEEARTQLAEYVEEALPRLAAALQLDLEAQGPTRAEVALLRPDLDLSRSGKYPLQDGWRRTLLGLETELGPVELDLGPELRLTVKGQVDRLERWDHEEGLAFLRILDYKDSRDNSLGSYGEGEAPFSTHLQTPLYMVLAERTLGAPATAVLLPLREEEPKPFAGVLTALRDSDPPWRERLDQRLAQVWGRALEGHFPATPGPHCDHCALGALCGRPVDLDPREEA